MSKEIFPISEMQELTQKPRKKKLKTNAGQKKGKNMKSLLLDLQTLAAVII